MLSDEIGICEFAFCYIVEYNGITRYNDVKPQLCNHLQEFHEAVKNAYIKVVGVNICSGILTIVNFVRSYCGKDIVMNKICNQKTGGKPVDLG